MAKPRRRRHNKHNESSVLAMKKNGEIEKIPCSRKAYKVSMRDDKNYQTKDFAVIKKALYGVKMGEVVYIPKEKVGFYILNNSKLAGYYSVNDKGPVRMTEELMDKYRKLKDAERATLLSLQGGLNG